MPTSFDEWSASDPALSGPMSDIAPPSNERSAVREHVRPPAPRQSVLDARGAAFEAMHPRFTWRYDRQRQAYVILRGTWLHQVIPLNRHMPTHTEQYVQRCVDILNGTRKG